MTRRERGVIVRLLAGFLLALLLGSGALLARSGSSSPQPGAVFGLPESVPLATDKSYGSNASLADYDAKERETALAAMEAAGLRWLRQRFAWDTIEKAPGVYDWQVWDEIVEGAAQHHLKIIAVLDGSPAWARPKEDAGNPLAPPAEERDFGAFARALAARYGQQIDYYEIWDEPNIAPHWGSGEIDPAGYARLLREGAVQVRAADPGATVLLAALAPTVEAGGANMSDLQFLDALYRWGAAEWFDIVAVQPYDFGQPVDALADPNQLNWARAGLLRGVMERYGDGSTAMWAVAFGLGSEEPKALQRVITQAREGWPWLGPMIWAAWAPGDAHGQYALVDASARPGRAYAALQDLTDTVAIAWPGVYPADHPSGSYEGDWRVTPSGADIGGSGDLLTIPFHGTRLDLTVRRGDYRAFLYVTVDGQPANALPADSEGRAYVVLYDPLRQAEPVTLARGLEDGNHVAQIVADRGWGQWSLAGWTVSRETPGAMPWLPLGLGLASVVTLAATGYASWPSRRAIVDFVGRVCSRYRVMDERLALGITAIVALLAWITIGTIQSLVGLSLLAVLLVLRPAMSVPLIVLALPFYQIGKPLVGKVFSMVEILTLLGVVGWAANWGLEKARLWSERGPQPVVSWNSRFTALDWGVIALVVVGALSLLWSAQLREAAREFRTVVLEAGIFYGLLRGLVQDRRAMWRVVDAWVLGAAGIAVVGILQWALGQNLITADGVWRVRGFYGSPNNLALYLGRVLPLCVAIGLWSRPDAAPGETIQIRRRWLYGLAAIVSAVAIFLTYSRGAWLLGVPVALLFLAAMRGRKSLLTAAGALLIVAIVMVPIAGPGRLASLLDSGDGTTFFRLQLWQSSWAMARDHPVLGVGLDNFLYYYRTHYVLPTAWEEFNLSHPHNLVLDFWLRLGIMGVAILGWLLAGFFRRGWRAYHRLPAGQNRLLVLGVMAGMVNFVAHGLVDNAFFLPDLAFVFMLMLALVQAMRIQTGDRSSASPNL